MTNNYIQHSLCQRKQNYNVQQIQCMKKLEKCMAKPSV